MAQILIFIPGNKPYTDTAVTPNVLYEGGEHHAFDSAVPAELAAANRIIGAGAGFDVSTLHQAAIGAFGAGTAAGPTVNAVGNTNTGLFWPAAGQLGVSVNGVESLRVRQTGVSVGSTVLGSNRLLVNGRSSFFASGVGLPTLGANNNLAAAFKNNASTADGGYGLGVAVAGLGQVSLQSMSFSTSSANLLLLNPLGGNVGVGTSAPSRLFSIQGAVPFIELRSSATSSTHLISSIIEYSSATGARAGYIGVNAQALEISTDNQATDIPIRFKTVGVTRVSVETDGGLVMAGASGGSKGPGTINAVGVHDDGSLLTDLVLDQAVDGRFDKQQYSTHPISLLIEDWWFDPEKYAEFWKEHRHLPAMPSWGYKNAPHAQAPSTGQLITCLTAEVETHAVLIDHLHGRIKALEADNSGLRKTVEVLQAAA